MMNKDINQISALYAQRAHLRAVPVKLDRYQAPAQPEQIFILRRLGPDEYYLVPLSGHGTPLLEGSFIFVIKAKEPFTVYCGKIFDILTRAIVPEKFYISGHTSLTNREDVLFAGELKFVNNRLVSWSNRSGHYQPASALRHINILPHISLLLPEHLYTDINFSELCTSSIAHSARFSRSPQFSFGSFSGHHSFTSNGSWGNPE